MATSSPTYYLGTLEEIVGSTLTKYVSAPGQAGKSGLPLIVRVGTGGALSYLARDGLGSLNAALDGSGNVTFQQLYSPYGTIRYTNGTAPTTQFFTGQHWDSTAGLAYYVARYYDPTPQQFISADTVQDGLNRYGYVHANPETYTDPTGHCTTYHWVQGHWWGVTVYVNDCFVQDINLVLGLAGIGLGVISAWCLYQPWWCASFLFNAFGILAAGGAIGWWAFVATAIIGAYIAWVNWADGQCGFRGVFLNFSWVMFPFTWAWIGRIC